MRHSDPQTSETSQEACPVCGAHALHLLYFPNVDITGIRQYDDMFGFGDVKPDQQPGIGCTACGNEWDDLAAFRTAQAQARRGLS
jgi:hypothetical protein